MTSMIEIFDSDKSETIDFREFVTGLSVLLKGSFEEKVDCKYFLTLSNSYVCDFS